MWCEIVSIYRNVNMRINLYIIYVSLKIFVFILYFGVCIRAVLGKFQLNFSVEISLCGL